MAAGERPKKIPKTSSVSILSFGNDPDVGFDNSELYKNLLIGTVNPANGLKRSYEATPVASQEEKKAPRPSSHNQDHILAERKRREKLSQRFIALSAIVPGLKKVMNSPSF